MKARTIISFGLLLAGLFTLGPSKAWAEVPPEITGVALQISRNNGMLPFVAFVPDPSTPDGIARELDYILVTFTVEDADWVDITTLEDLDLYVRKQSFWIPYRGLPPEPPSITEDNREFIAPPNISLTGITATVVVLFQVPQFLGPHQYRLAGEILWDVHWLMRIEVTNSEDPGDTDPVAIASFDLWAVENPLFAAPNPPPFADAGGDQDVALDAVTRTVEVTLDASRTFDQTNVGFDPNDSLILAKDNLQFTWEWLAGPVQIAVDQLVPDPSNAAVARVVLNTPGPPDYVFRVIVDDGVNGQVSADTVVVHVRSSAPTNAAPVAVVAGPTDTVPVGSTITLDASGSWDPDSGDTENLTFRWRQTNEVGGDLSTDQVVASFQPLSGQNAATATWRAVAEGTYYFRVLVRDQPELRDSFLTDMGLSDTATVTVVVAGNAATSGQQADRDGNGGKQTIGPVGCGGGLFPLAVLPALLWLLRGRYR